MGFFPTPISHQTSQVSLHVHFFLSMNLLIGSMRSSSLFILSEGGTTASPSSRSSSSALNHISSSSSSVRASRRKRWFLKMERMLSKKMHSSVIGEKKDFLFFESSFVGQISSYGTNVNHKHVVSISIHIHMSIHIAQEAVIKHTPHWFKKLSRYFIT